MGRWHAHYARRCGAAICGVVDPHRMQDDLRRTFRGAIFFKELQPLLRELKPDVLHVCTPAETHEEIIEAALDAGVHLLVEKPLVSTAEITARLLAKAQQAQRLLVPVHQFAFQNGVLQASASLDKIGTPLHFDALFCSAGGARMRQEELSGLIADILPHPLSLMERFFPGILGEVEWSHFRTGDGESRIVGTARAISISILVSLHGRPTEASLRLTGTKGSVRLDLFHGYAVTETGAVSRGNKILHPFTLAARSFWAAGRNLAGRAVRNVPAYPGLPRLIADFYQAVDGGGDSPLSPRQVMELARVRDGLVRMTTRPAVL